jgi:hypothetical protein
MKYLRMVLSIVFIFAAAACNLNAPLKATATSTGTSSATQIPFPSLAPTQAPPTSAPIKLPTLTLAATATPLPTATHTAVPTTRPTAVPPTRVPTNVPTSTPTNMPTTAPTNMPATAPTAVPTLVPTATSSSFPQVPEAILILAPGPNSSIISSVKISGQADPTFEQNLAAKVTGENGLSIANKSTTIQAEAGKRGPFSVEISFKITRDQPGRVAVWTTSAKDGGLVHFTSQDVQLKLNGTASITAEKNLFETLVITKPAPATQISGGKIFLQGWSGPVFENTIHIVVCGEGGTGKKDIFCGTADNVLAKTTTQISAPDVGQPGMFSLTISYKISKPVNGRLAVYYTSPRDGGLLHLTSVPVQLKP